MGGKPAEAGLTSVGRSLAIEFVGHATLLVELVPADVDLGDGPLVGWEAVNAVLRRMAVAAGTVASEPASEPASASASASASAPASATRTILPG